MDDNRETPSAAIPPQADNQEKGKKIKWQKNRRSKQRRMISCVSIFLPPDLFAILSSNLDKN
jgi:hypothetical protein